MYEYVIGIDQSYTRTGICVINAKTSKIIIADSVDCKGCKNGYEKRMELRDRLGATLDSMISDLGINRKEILCIIERIRLFSQNKISQSYIESAGSLKATIYDVFMDYGIPVYSVDTRSWKSQIVGTTKPKQNKFGINPNKYPTIEYIKRKGYLKYVVIPYKGKSKKGIIKVEINGSNISCKINDDLCDAICIALYGTLPENKRKLKEEKI
uniref:Holliday junction resolvase n=1 Tax=Dulem virus 36 TaxID=3145754 RepID=A0AAU8AZK7_9CAUD